MNAITNEIRLLAERLMRPVRLMEVCGTHTVAIFRHGIRSLIPKEIMLLSGPGCPVCVTSVRDVETVRAISSTPDIILTTFGDMMRVPGNSESLSDAKAHGSDIRIVYSPLDALDIARRNPGKQVVFFAAGFETTSPLVAGTLIEADRKKIDNFSIYSTHKTVPPAIRALISSRDVNVDGFILPGHVSTIIGVRPYQFMAEEYRKPSVITGFDAPDILNGIRMILAQLVADEAKIEVQYTRVVRYEGNPKAVSVVEQCFEPQDAEWRGIGTIPGSGLRLRDAYRHRDVLSRLTVSVPVPTEARACSCGEVLRGIKIPTDCLLFGKACTPEKPVGACMVSSEGSCAAYYKYSGWTARHD